MKNAVTTTHRLNFYSRPWKLKWYWRLAMIVVRPKNDDKFPEIKWEEFRVGTCVGQFRVTPEAYEILSIINSAPGNGHLEDLFEWFEYGCRRSRLPLRILRFTNQRFKKHLIDKRGFHAFGEDDVEINIE